MNIEDSFILKLNFQVFIRGFGKESRGNRCIHAFTLEVYLHAKKNSFRFITS